MKKLRCAYCGKMLTDNNITAENEEFCADCWKLMNVTELEESSSNPYNIKPPNRGLLRG